MAKLTAGSSNGVPSSDGAKQVAPNTIEGVIKIWDDVLKLLPSLKEAISAKTKFVDRLSKDTSISKFIFENKTQVQDLHLVKVVNADEGLDIKQQFDKKSKSTIKPFDVMDESKSSVSVADLLNDINAVLYSINPDPGMMLGAIDKIFYLFSKSQLEKFCLNLDSKMLQLRQYRREIQNEQAIAIAQNSQFYQNENIDTMDAGDALASLIKFSIDGLQDIKQTEKLGIMLLEGLLEGARNHEHHAIQENIKLVATELAKIDNTNKLSDTQKQHKVSECLEKHALPKVKEYCAYISQKNHSRDKTSSKITILPEMKFMILAMNIAANNQKIVSQDPNTEEQYQITGRHTQRLDINKSKDTNMKIL